MKLLDKVREVIGKKHGSIRTQQANVDWMKRFILCHGKQYPKDMREAEISQYISHLASSRQVASSTQNQAFKAIVSLYQHSLMNDPLPS
jgi:hypothetical protein